nr:RagB/SusD family nutrient uptake outer membrane protein [Sunxiuqinia sp.]
MKKNILLLLIGLFAFTACENYLDRPAKTVMNDQNYWTSENNVRMFANGFYENYFPGYNTSYGTAYAPRRGYIFSDDLTTTGKQFIFESQAPASRIDTREGLYWLSNYGGPTWNFAWVRKSNLFIERIDEMQTDVLEEEAYKHWSAVARFFRGFEYSRLVSVFGDVPYYAQLVPDTDLDELYKDRTDRTTVMDAVYDDFVYVLGNIREWDGNQYLNKYVAASFISRFMLFEGTWQKYHLNNDTQAKKYLELDVDAADVVLE